MMRTGWSGTPTDQTVESERSSDRFSTAVVEAVASATNARAETMPPLFDVIDPEALDRLFTQTRTGTVAFRYCGVVVSVRADGRISIVECDEWEL